VVVRYGRRKQNGALDDQIATGWSIGESRRLPI
jgi:hypothetical protein